MGDENQFMFLKSHADKIQGPVLEIGSKDYGNTPNYKSFLSGKEHVGIDMEEGQGVDLILDLTGDFEFIDPALGGKRFKTIICNSVLEHCASPFKMCANIERLLEPGGILFVSVPFAWRIHGYPSDYWRFTPQGIRILFPEIEFINGLLSTSNVGEVGPIDDYMFRTELDIRKGVSKGVYGMMGALIIGLLRKANKVKKVGFLHSIFSYPYLFPPVMVSMVGQKKVIAR